MSINRRGRRKCFSLIGGKNFLRPVLICPGISKKKREATATFVANLTVIDVLDMENNCIFESK